MIINTVAKEGTHISPIVRLMRQSGRASVVGVATMASGSCGPPPYRPVGHRGEMAASPAYRARRTVKIGVAPDRRLSWTFAFRMSNS